MSVEGTAGVSVEGAAGGVASVVVVTGGVVSVAGGSDEDSTGGVPVDSETMNVVEAVESTVTVDEETIVSGVEPVSVAVLGGVTMAVEVSHSVTVTVTVVSILTLEDIETVIADV